MAALPDPIQLRDADLTSDETLRAYKPPGFWYEVDGDWRRWCEGEGFGSERLQHMHRVELNECKILFIDTLKKLDEFHRKFHMHRPLTPDYSLITINWPTVAELYDGLEIAPYQWARRLTHDFMWYYGWDCASGVIWRPKNATVFYVGPYTPATSTQESGAAI